MKLNELEIWYLARNKAEHEYLVELVDVMPIDINFKALQGAVVAPDPLPDPAYDLAVNFNKYDFDRYDISKYSDGLEHNWFGHKILDIEPLLKNTITLTEGARRVSSQEFYEETGHLIHDVINKNFIIRFPHKDKEITAILRYWSGNIKG
ncbi:hypothetical protein KY343_06055 [Candidatus Woesearchaeota archaeon]|nr:hypothetical protein [Candidatus Woesearchaeota archaeon]